jgi:hypothetical protein
LGLYNIIQHAFIQSLQTTINGISTEDKFKLQKYKDDLTQVKRGIVQIGGGDMKLTNVPTIENIKSCIENVNSKLTYHVLKFYDIDDKDDEKDDEKGKNIMMIFNTITMYISLDYYMQCCQKLIVKLFKLNDESSKDKAKKQIWTAWFDDRN